MRISRAHRPAVIRSAAVLLLAGGLAVGPLAAAPAFADGETVRGLSTGDDGTLAVGLDTSEALWVKVSVRESAAADAAVLASTDDLTYSWQRGWSTVEPLALPEGKAYGDYPVDVDYRLPGGTVQHWTGAEHGTAGRFVYRLHTGVGKLGYDRDTTDFDHRTAVLSGTVTTFDPATGTTGPSAPGTQVRVNWTARVGADFKSGSATATSGADGTFSVGVTPGGAVTAGSAVALGRADTDPAAAVALPELPARAVEYRISGDPSAKRVHKGSTFTMRGTVQRLTDQGWKPFAGAPLVTTPQPADVYRYTVPGLMGTGTADASGNFAFPVTATKSTWHYTYVRPSEYLADYADAEHLVNVPTAGTYSGVSMSLDAYGKVTAKGILAGSCWGAQVWLQYSKDGRTGWKSLTSVQASDNGTGKCSFSMGAWGYTDGYYRVYHSESDGMLAVASGTKRLHRTVTRIVSFDMTPNSPRLGGALKAKGTLQYLSGGKWRAYKGGKIVIVLKPKGESSWYWTVKGKTDAAGHFSLSTKAYADATWGAYLEADSTHFSSESKTEYINAR
ncbi:hypothetical protein ACFYXS_18200 [Streptomyces sp. NPDC002574]|uniref:hypothetical protein n=1 Tax=Streptomyces sp. NPDC002574 TaxID=3364652 RepID=UPI0036A1F48F